MSPTKPGADTRTVISPAVYRWRDSPHRTTWRTLLGFLLTPKKAASSTGMPWLSMVAGSRTGVGRHSGSGTGNKRALDVLNHPMGARLASLIFNEARCRAYLGVRMIGNVPYSVCPVTRRRSITTLPLEGLTN